MSVIQALHKAARAATVAVALIALGSPVSAQQQPSPAAIATAKEIITLTGATNLFTPIVPGVVEQAKILFLQQNPALGNDLNAVAADLRTQLTPRLSEVTDEVAKLYATNFSEKELKDLLAFYKSPLGSKLIKDQPIIAEASVRFAQNWANKLSEEVMTMMRAEMKKKGHNL
ncbi:MAG TPA: DUF2059 domain-containing protein [Pseudolabrys sp.]|jgi:hypothetical protein|nr:DUF2059 domain-containing protein [Pseudolabrys sp.]